MLGVFVKTAALETLYWSKSSVFAIHNRPPIQKHQYLQWIITLETALTNLFQKHQFVRWLVSFFSKTVVFTMIYTRVENALIWLAGWMPRLVAASPAQPLPHLVTRAVWDPCGATWPVAPCRLRGLGRYLMLAGWNTIQNVYDEFASVFTMGLSDFFKNFSFYVK